MMSRMAETAVIQPTRARGSGDASAKLPSDYLITIDGGRDITTEEVLEILANDY